MTQRTLKEVLQSTSDVLFPMEDGEAEVTLQSSDSVGDTALHVLIWRGDTEGAILLIKSGADVNAPGDMGETPLHVAIGKQNRAVITALVNAHARKDIVSEFRETPVEKARRYGISI